MAHPFYDFYHNADQPNRNGLTFEYFLYEMGHSDMETMHNYIQWVFPGPTVSRMQRDAAPFKCTDAEYRRMASDPIVMGRVHDAIAKVLGFWGITYDEDAQAVHIRQRHEQRFLDVLILHYDHNQARFTRLLTFLQKIGLPELAAALFELVTNYEARIAPDVYAHWLGAMYP